MKRTMTQTQSAKALITLADALMRVAAFSLPRGTTQEVEDYQAIMQALSEVKRAAEEAA